MIYDLFKDYDIITTAGFLLYDSQRRFQFFEKTLLFVDTIMEVVLRIVFLSLSNANLELDATKLTQKFYITVAALVIATTVKCLNQYQFVESEVDGNSNCFVIYVTVLKTLESVMSTYRLWAPLLASLQQEKALSKVPKKYIEYIDVFSPNLLIQLPEYIRTHKYAIKLVEGK